MDPSRPASVLCIGVGPDTLRKLSSFSSLELTVVHSEDDEHSQTDIGREEPDCILVAYGPGTATDSSFFTSISEAYQGLPLYAIIDADSPKGYPDRISASVDDYWWEHKLQTHPKLVVDRMLDGMVYRQHESDQCWSLSSTGEVFAGIGGWKLEYPSRDVQVTQGLRDLLDIPETTTLSVDQLVNGFHPDDRDMFRSVIEEPKILSSNEFLVVTDQATFRSTAETAASGCIYLPELRLDDADRSRSVETLIETKASDQGIVAINGTVCQRPTAEAGGLSVDSRSADTY